MKTPAQYIPKHGLTFFYLAKIMSRKELDDLIKKYVAAKVAHSNSIKYKRKKI